MGPDFGRQLRDYLTHLEEARQLGRHHDHLRKLFLDFLKEAFPDLRTDEIELEKQIKALQVRGFIDALYRDLIFEFKRDLADERPKGLEELKRYLQAQPDPEQLFGILTDGRSFEAYTIRGGELTAVDSVTLEAAGAEEALLWLDCYLFAQKQVTPTTQDVIHRFGENSPVFATAFTTLHRLLTQVRKHGPVDTKVAEWGRLLSHVYGSDIADDKLFLRHTYLAVFARLLAFAAIKSKVPSDQELAGVVNGRTFEALGIQNLVEEDFFAWILERQITAETMSVLRGLAAHLRVYDLSRLNEDLLKELYQGLVDPMTRHDLGEYYTPDWLAELTLREAGFGSGKSLLDPSCGSGTFLFTAIRLLKEQGVTGPNLVRWAQDDLGGLDIHPLAVIIARVNFLLAIAPELGNGGGPVRIPVYMADTLRAPEVEIQPTIPVEVALSKLPHNLPKRFDLPIAVLGQPGRMERLLDALRDFALMSGAEKDLLAGLRARLLQEGAGEWDWVFENNFRLLRHLDAIGRNTVYVFIMRNTYRQEVFSQRKFDMVVGNPPWLSYRFIQQPQYQQRVKKLTRYHGLMDSRSVNLFTQMDLATLFYAHCYDRFLKDGSTIAFVMPRSVLTGAKQHARFQTKFIQDKVLDLEGVSPLFNVPACVLIEEKGRPTSAPTTTVVKGELPTKNISLHQANQYLTFSPTGAQPVLKAASQSPYLSKFFQGATIVPRCLWFVRQADVLAVDRAKPQLETDPAVVPQAKEPWKGILLAGQVEAGFLYATLLSTDLVPFGYRRLRTVVLPLAVDGRGKAKLIDRREALRQGNDGLARWLEVAEGEWNRRKKGTERVRTPYDRLDYDGNLVRQRPSEGWKVLHPRSGTYLTACAMSVAELQHSASPLEFQGYVVDSSTHGYQTSDPKEAHYLSAVLNAPSVDKAIKPSQTRGAFGERDIYRRPFEELPIPTFDSNDSRHARLAELSKQCHRKVAAMSLPHGRSIGRLRQEIRRLLKPELDEIDDLVKGILER